MAASRYLRRWVREAGRLVLTNARLYFQPLHTAAGGAPVLSHPLADVAAVARRRCSLRPTGMLPKVDVRPE